MTDERKARCQWKRCYKMVSLLHTNRTMDFFFFVGLKILPGNAHESPVLYELVRQFVETMGKGVMKRLILDRGFLDGKSISSCKKDYGIDVLIPVRRNMDIYKDAMALFRLPDVTWVCLQEPVVVAKETPRPRPKAIVKREKKRQKTIEQIKQQEPPPPPEGTIVKREAATIGEFRSWSSCTVPLSVVANRETYADGRQKTWLLLDTKEVEDPSEASEEYHLRTAIEERHRQLKCFINLTKFTSRAFSMVVNQVVFIRNAFVALQGPGGDGVNIQFSNNLKLQIVVLISGIIQSMIDRGFHRFDLRHIIAEQRPGGIENGYLIEIIKIGHPIRFLQLNC